LIERYLNGEITTILYEDECAIRDYQALGYCWFPVGKQRIVKTFGAHGSVKIMGTLNPVTGELFCIEVDGRVTAKEFIAYLARVIENHPEGKTALILDNAKIHRAKSVKEFVEAHKEQLELVFLPPYSPKLNKIEPFWKWIKSDIMKNVFYSDTTEIRAGIVDFLKEIAKKPSEVIKRLCPDFLSV